MKGFTATGEHGYMAGQIWSDGTPGGSLTGQVTVQAGTPALYACIGDPTSGAGPSPSQVALIVRGPDGTVYNQDANTSTAFVTTIAGSLYALLLLQPAAGTWTISCQASGAASFRACLATVPTEQPVGAVLAAVQDRYPGPRDVAGDAYIYGLFRWACWPAAVVVAAAAATSGRALPLARAVEQIWGVTAAVADRIVGLIAGQALDGMVTTIAQQIGAVTPSLRVQVLANGAAEHDMTGWTIVANGGNGWSTWHGDASSLGYAHVFAVSYAWCAASQLVDLRQAGGLTGAYLDQAPPITVTDWIAARYPAAGGPLSQYALSVRLLDANQQPLKTFESGILAVTGTTDPPDRLGWLRVQCTFTGYGTGARYLSFEHGAQNPAAWAAGYGLQVTGATVAVQLGLPAQPPTELLVNGSATDGLTGWTNTSPVGNPWQAETGPGASCPASPGQTDFGVASGVGAKSQLIDLVASGLTPAYLDTEPLVQVGQWLGLDPAGRCRYGLVVELRDGQQGVLQRYDAGAVEVAVSPGAFTAYQPLLQNLSGYGTGLRYVYLEQRAEPLAGTPGQGTARLTGTTVLIQPPPSGTATTTVQDGPLALAGAPSADPLAGVANPAAVDPTVRKWVCFISSYSDTNERIDGTGWLIGRRASYFIVVTAAHNLYHPRLADNTGWWANQVRISPDAGGGSPYQTAVAERGQLRVPLGYLMRSQAKPDYDTLSDYAVIVVRGVNWVADGFVPVVELDHQINQQRAVVTAYPSVGNVGIAVMNAEDLILKAHDASQITFTSKFGHGASGGPVYIKEGYRAVGVFSHGSSGGSGDTYATRINAEVLANLHQWSTTLDPDDHVCTLQLVIRTSMEPLSSTDSPLSCEFDGHTYDLEKLWIGGANNWWGGRNEQGNFDAYDLTPDLRRNYPGGIFLHNLVGKNFTICLEPGGAWFNNDWQVESVVVFVNDQMISADMINRWLSLKEGQTRCWTGTFRLWT